MDSLATVAGSKLFSARQVSEGLPCWQSGESAASEPQVPPEIIVWTWLSLTGWSLSDRHDNPNSDRLLNLIPY